MTAPQRALNSGPEEETFFSGQQDSAQVEVGQVLKSLLCICDY